MIKCKLALPQKDIILEVEPGENLMAVLLKEKIPVASSCSGEGICGKCKLIINGPVYPMNPLESQTHLRNHLNQNERLSCQIEIIDDLTLTASYW